MKLVGREARGRALLGSSEDRQKLWDPCLQIGPEVLLRPWENDSSLSLQVLPGFVFVNHRYDINMINVYVV